MFEITSEDITKVESALLGQYKSFSNEQRNIIKYEQSGDFVACPGSGKTTVLIARLAILLRKIKEANLDYGICVITHTNVGVEEILNKLKILGINDVAYPHFIGTIHDFLNTFFALRAYTTVSSRDRFFFIENEEYKGYFSRFFEKHKPSWWSFSAPFSAVERTQLSINDKKEISLIGFEDKTYRNELLNTFKDMFYSGYLRHSDTIALSKFYIDKNAIELRKAFQARFKYLFIDETQDTSIEQYHIILKIIESNEETIIQRYGDPYQALYNLYYGEPDAWKPPVEQRIELATSNRFGQKIAKILRTTCIERYDHLVGNEFVPSLEPHILLYEDQAQLLEAYAKLLASYNLPLNTKKIYAVAQHHDAVAHFHIDYQKSKSEIQKKSSFADCLNEVHKVMSRTLRKKNENSRSQLDFSPSKLDDFLNKEFPLENSDLRSILSKLIRQVYLRKDCSSELSQFELLYQKILTDNFGIVIESNDLASDVEIVNKYILKIFTTETHADHVDNNNYLYNDVLIHLNTIHAVKGETHLATLLLESTVNREEYSDLYDIMPFLIGQYDERLSQNTNIKDTLKLAYVALSRPTHFAGIAIKEDNMSQEDVIAAKSHGWKVVKVNEIVLPN
ncbi:UvrD-helicase domain-containing protein [Paenibacillus sp. SYP-B3998]|uniref:UvrD-helicase domain-containing protein n=1 Tax=Paenibacillus sp. SYP-B3998 TaxID=2678564 RepID=A0A6G3ZXP0_9BACL|nr:UvrD-helicase domain-containing protein [Paenibacillus sp. SYP-B3998]NEW06875.1 UvrD-helicase domain-containing protein [Paenibacillus sp. SYP-B3998]